MSGGFSGKFSRRQCKIQLPRNNLREKKVLEGAFFRLSKSLKSKISATKVLPPGYNGFITNFPFGATRRLERFAITICDLGMRTEFLRSGIFLQNGQ